MGTTFKGGTIMKLKRGDYVSSGRFPTLIGKILKGESGTWTILFTDGNSARWAFMKGRSLVKINTIYGQQLAEKLFQSEAVIKAQLDRCNVFPFAHICR